MFACRGNLTLQGLQLSTTYLFDGGTLRHTQALFISRIYFSKLYGSFRKIEDLPLRLGWTEMHEQLYGVDGEPFVADCLAELQLENMVVMAATCSASTARDQQPMIERHICLTSTPLHYSDILYRQRHRSLIPIASREDDGKVRQQDLGGANRPMVYRVSLLTKWT